MNMRQLPSRAIALGVLAAVAGTIIWGLQPERVPVESRAVRRGALVVYVRDDGVTRIKERHVVSAPLAGRMNRVSLHVGDAVRADETLITSIEPLDPSLLDPRAEAEARARVETALAAKAYTEHVIDRAKVAIEYTTADLDRARQLYPSKAVTHEQLDAAERAWRTAVEDLEEAEQEFKVVVHLVALMEAALMRSTKGGPAPRSESDWRMDIRSPVDGRVLRVVREDFGPVDVGAGILEVGDPASLEAVIDLVSEDAVKVRPGDRCEITSWGGDRPLAGHVRVVEPRGFTKVSPLGVEEQRVNVILDIDAVPEARAALGDGFRVEAGIIIDRAHDVVLVPLAALFRRGTGEAVFVVEDSRARLVTVRTGRRGDREAEVLEGLSGGEQVIVYPGEKVSDRTPLAVRAG
jgi:HlyD family secretion protein